MRRSASIGAVDEKARTVEIAFSSDVELERWPDVAEKLSHEPGAVDMSRLENGAALLFNHDPDQHLGVIESASIDSDGKGRAVVRFGTSAFAEEKWQDVQAKILTKTSVGYRINEVKLTTESDVGPDVYTVTAWQPQEISFVTIPADDSVGVGRNAGGTPPPVKNQRSQNNNNMKDQLIALLQKRGITIPENATDADLVRMVSESEPSHKPTNAPNITEVRESARKDEVTRRNTLIALGVKYGVPDAANEAIENGLTIEASRELFNEALVKRTQALKDAVSPIGLSEREAQGFWFTRLLNALADPMDKKAQDGARFELEVCAAAANKSNRRDLKGALIPIDVLRASMGRAEGNNIVSQITGAGYTGTAGQTVQTNLLASSFIDILRNRTVFGKLARPLTGLVGNVDLPKQTDHAIGYWISEDGVAPLQGADFGVVPVTPNTVAARSILTRRSLMQSSLDLEMITRQDLMAGLALAIDLAGFYGTGANGQPGGITTTTGINVVDFATAGAPTFKELVLMETLIAQGNADVDSMRYVINPTMRGYFKGAHKLAGATDSITIWEPGNTVNGYNTDVTNQIVAGDCFFGNFADAVLAFWSGLQVLCDPYSGSSQGRLQITTMQDVDITVRRGQSFTYGTFTGTAGSTLSPQAGN